MLLLHQVGCCTLVTNTHHQRHFSSGPMELLEQQPFAHCRCVKHDLLICALTQVKMCIASNAFVGALALTHRSSAWLFYAL